MTVELDGILRAGAVTAAALVQRSVHCDVVRAGWFHGEKRPVAILIRCDDVTMAFEIDGSRIALDDLDRRFPGQCAEFERRAITSPES